jgi:two-component system LytT family response regulator
MKAVIIEDEPLSLQALRFSLSQHCRDLEVVGTAASVPEAFNVVQALRPDLLFLDLKLGGQLGFDLLDQLGVIDFQLIYTTAYAEFLRRAAFEYGGVDYLLKPVSGQELRQAVEKAAAVHRQKKSADTLHVLDRQRFSRLIVPSHSEYEFLFLSCIVWCQAHRAYSELHLQDGSRRTLSKPLAQLEQYLAPAGFLRVHQSALINTYYVGRYLPGKKGGTVVLTNGAEIEIGETYRAGFKEWMRGV